MSSLWSVDPLFDDLMGVMTRRTAPASTSLVAHLSPFHALSSLRCDLVEVRPVV